jgi:hypothetical protein
LDSFTVYSDTLYASARPKDTDYLQVSLESYVYTLGLITYFSNELEIKIPDDLEGIDYEYTDKGKYLILSTNNFPKDKETLVECKNKLLEIMKEIKERVPAYSKF